MKIANNVCLVFIVLLCTIFQPTGFVSANEKSNLTEKDKSSQLPVNNELTTLEDYNLYKVKNEIVIENTITLNEETYIYGKEAETAEEIALQFADTYITIPRNNVDEIELKKEGPQFVGMDQIETEESKTFSKGEVLYAIKPDKIERVLINREIEYPIHQNEQGIEVVYLGNTVFYLSEKDRLSMEESMIDSTTEEIASDGELLTDEKLVNETVDNELEEKQEDIPNEPLVEEKLTSEKDLEEDMEEEVSEKEEIKIEEGTSKQKSIEQEIAPSKKIEEKPQVTTFSTYEARQAVDDPWEGTFADYFKVIEDNQVVYSKGNTKILGTLMKGQVYPIDSDYGNWHQIQYGTTKGYVYKADTLPDDGTSVKNENNSYTHSSQSFVTLQETTVYDNSSGSLVEIGTIQKGERYPIVSEYGANWSRIIFSDRVGYVLNSEVRHEFTGEEEYFTVLTSNLPIYDNRSGRLKQVGTFTKGQVYEIVSDYGNWHRIQYNNHYGYVYKGDTEPSKGSYIKNKNSSYSHSDRSFTALQDVIVYDNSSGKLKAFGTIDKGQSYYITSDYGNWWRIVFADRVGYVLKSNIRQNFTGGEKFFQVLTSNLPIYDNRSGSLKQVGTLTKGQVYEIDSDYGNWHRIQYNNHYGYVYKGDTEPSTEGNIKNKNTSYNHSNRIFTALQNVIVYDNSSGKLKAFGTIDKGQSYYIANNYGSWWRIVFADRVGYVHKSGVQEMTNSQVGAFKVTENASLSVMKDGKRVWVATLIEGNVFQKVADYGNWLKVKYGDQTGYIWREATAPATFDFKENKTKSSLLTLTDSTVYASPNDSDPIAIIEASERIPIVREVNDKWYEIKLAGRNLFIQSDNVLNTDSFDFMIDDHPYIEIIQKYMSDIPFIYDDKNTSKNETIEHANLMLTNKIRFPNYNNGIPMDYTNGIDWKKGEGVDSEHQRSFLRQLHGLFFINDLIEASYITDNEKMIESYIRKGYEYIQEWDLNNPYHNPKSNMAWHDEGTARRLTTLVNFFEVGKSILNDQEKLELFDMMVFHADLLNDDNFYAKNTNHGMFQDEALIVFSKYFYDIGVFSEYYNTAVSRMSDYFDGLISTDGVHLEHSPSYHQTISGSLKSYAEALSQFGDQEIANNFYNRYNNMVKYATHVIKPDGNWPLIADTYAKDRPLTTLWKDNSSYQYAITKGLIGNPPSETNVIFPDAGYAIFRDQWTNTNEGTYLFFTAAYHTNYHKHSDDLSLWIYNNADIITEAGPHSYTLSDPITEYAYSSYGHNTLIVDDKGLPRVDGKYNSTYIEEYDIDDEKKPSVTGVNKRYDGVTHRRNVIYDKTNDIIHVNDSMLSKDNHNYKLLWHLAPGIEPIINHESNEIILKKNEETLMEINLSSVDNINISSVYGDEDEIYKSWTFDNSRKNARIDVHTLIVELDGKTGNIQTSFNLMSN